MHGSTVAAPVQAVAAHVSVQADMVFVGRSVQGQVRDSARCWWVRLVSPASQQR